MTDTIDQVRIRDRAYAIWEKDERPEGRASDHWERAERELRAEEEGQTTADPETDLEATSGSLASLAPETEGPATEMSRVPERQRRR